MADERLLTWSVEESGGYESAWISTSPGTLAARGRAVGVLPEPYWIEYALEAHGAEGTDGAYATRRLHVTAEDAAGVRRLDLRCEDGRWTVDGQAAPGLDGALDCDLGRSPLTNSMPVLRHRLHRGPGEHRMLMAFVSVPDLAVRPSGQSYTHLDGDSTGALVRYASGAYRSDLEFDEDGMVVAYPGMAHRLVPKPPGMGGGGRP